MTDSDRRVLFIGADEYELGVIQGGNVGLRLRTSEVEALLPALELILRLAPSEARQMADGLRRWADVAEAETPQGGGRA